MPKINLGLPLRTRPATAVFALCGAIVCSVAGPASAQPVLENFLQEYAVKFVCGTSTGRSAVPGRYQTAINVHNPGRRTSILRKVALAPPGQPGRVTGFRRTVLEHDQAIDFDCVDILDQAGPHRFLTGFLVIRSDLGHELDVVAVYTATAGTGVSIDTERVPTRRVAVPGVADPGGQ